MARRYASVTIDLSGLTRLTSQPTSQGARLLEWFAGEAQLLAQVNSADNGSIPEGIIVGPVEGKSIKVISTNPHTLLVHNGSRPHQIFPRRRGGRLRFVVGGRVVYARKVNHPGYAGNPFLTDALKQL